MLGMSFQRALEPNTLAIGTHPKHCRRDTPRAFTFCVCARTLAGVVVAVQPSRGIARLASVGRGPVLRLEDVATKSRTEGRVVRSCGHDRRNGRLYIARDKIESFRLAE